MDALVGEIARQDRPRRASGSLHLNDSQTPLGSNRDRHANIGEGELGDEGCAAFLSAPGLRRAAVRARDARREPQRARPREEIALAVALRERGAPSEARRC